MLAKSRTESEISADEVRDRLDHEDRTPGRRCSCPRGRRAASWPKYLKTPFSRIPSTWYATQTTSVSTSGIEMFAVAA